MKKNHLYIIIAALILFNIHMTGKISNIENTLNSVYREQNYIRNEISGIYSNVEESLKKQASILDSFTINFREELNAENFTVPVDIRATPKENTSNLTAHILINDQRLPMVKNGAAFALSIDAYIFEPLNIKIVLTDKDAEKIETMAEYYDLQHKYLMDMNAHFIGSTKFDSGKYSYNGDISIHLFGSSYNRTEEISIISYVNDEIKDKQKADMQGNDSSMPSLPSVKGEVLLSANDRFELYLVVTDKYGLNYKYIVLADEIDSQGNLVKMSPEWTSGTLMEIKDKNGKVLLEENIVKEK